MKRLFITGASGLLGSNIIVTVPKKFSVYGSYNTNKVNFKNCTLLKVDISDKTQVKKIKDVNPDLIVHCAAYVNVDGCEQKPDYAYQSNVIGTENIVNISEEVGCYLIHISTDAVFDGKKGNYSENDKTNPINVYGKTKLEAEEIVKKSDTNHCIARTNIYGWNKLNKFSIAEWMIDKLSKNEELPSFKDVTFTPILVNNLSVALFEIFDKKINSVLNVSGSESCNKLEYAKTISHVFNYNEELIKPISVDDLNLPAKRGKNISLNTSKAQSLLKTELYNVKDGLQEMKALKEQGYVEELKRP